MAEEKAKVKISKWYSQLLKWSAFVPSLLLLPKFVSDPEDWRIVFLAMVVVYWFLVFMIPHSIIRYLISRHNFGQRMVNVLSLWSVCGMYISAIWLWFGVFSGVSNAGWSVELESLSTGIFVIPFISLVWVGIGMLCLTLLYKIYYYVKRAND